VLIVSLTPLGDGASYQRAKRPSDTALKTLDLSIPRDQILPTRVAHWKAAIDLWLEHPVLGAGIGRYSLLKLAPPRGIVDEGPGGSGKAVTSFGPSNPFERWLRGTGDVDFVAANVLPGDTIESREGGWGPIVISAAFSSTQLVLEEAPPRAGRNMDYLIRHPRIDYLRPHPHDATDRRLLHFTQAHNNFLLVAADLGLLGVLALAWLVACIAGAVVTGLRTGASGERPLLAGAGLGVAALLVAALAQDPLTSLPLAIVFWSVAAMTVMPAVRNAEGAEPDGGARWGTGATQPQSD
jgi:hypothetical protein